MSLDFRHCFLNYYHFDLYRGSGLDLAGRICLIDCMFDCRRSLESGCAGGFGCMFEAEMSEGELKVGAGIENDSDFQLDFLQIVNTRSPHLRQIHSLHFRNNSLLSFLVQVYRCNDYNHY